jgi:serine O-acetyltransferase
MNSARFFEVLLISLPQLARNARPQADNLSLMECSLDEFARAILASYEQVGGLNNTDRHNLPSKRALESLCEQLLQFLFPGFHDERPIHKDELASITNQRLHALAKQLEDQIGKSLSVTGSDSDASRVDHVRMRFLGGLPSVRELLRTDILAAYEGDPAALSSEEIILSYPFLEAIAIQRCAHVLYREGVPLLPRMMTEWAHTRTGIDIHPGAEIGEYFSLIMARGL